MEFVAKSSIKMVVIATQDKKVLARYLKQNVI